MFRKVLFIAALVGAAVAIAVPVASANSGKGSGTAFKATYQSGGVTYTCSGSHVVNKNTTALGMDDETCLVSGDDPTWQTGTYGPGVWASDYFYFVANPGQIVVDKTLVVTRTANGDGTFTETFLATY